MKKIEEINDFILENRNNGKSVKEVSDGFHTFRDYIEMRNELFVALCNAYPDISWKSKRHYDEENDSMYNGDFIAGINTPAGMISFHLKLEYWDELLVDEIDRSPYYDGYTYEDVKLRIKSLKDNTYL